jgi:Zn-dependent protease
MGLITLLRQQPAAFFLLVIPLLYSVILHEISHGLVALWFGDRTAKQAGRLTLNPLPHIDPLGALLLFFVGFGWARPVPVNYERLKDSKMAIIAVSLAGCLTNIALAALFLFLIRLEAIRSHEILVVLCVVAARINTVLAAFNLIPIPPLDGSRVVMVFLPAKIQMLSARFERLGLLVLMVLLYTGVLSPVIRFIESVIQRVIS